MTHGSELFQQDRMPTLAEVIEVLRTFPHHVERCRHTPCRGRQFSDDFYCVTCRRTWDIGDQPPYPDRCYTTDVWLDLMGVWIEIDGSQFSADQARGTCRPGWFGRWRLRRAVQYALVMGRIANAIAAQEIGDD